MYAINQLYSSKLCKAIVIDNIPDSVPDSTQSPRLQTCVSVLGQLVSALTLSVNLVHTSADVQSAALSAVVDT